MKNFLFFLALSMTLLNFSSCNKDDDTDDNNSTGCDAEGDCLELKIDGEQFYANFTQGTSFDIFGATTLNFNGLEDLNITTSNSVQMVILNPVEGSLDYTFTQSGEPTITYYDGESNSIVIGNGNLTVTEYDAAGKFIEGNFSGTGVSNNGDTRVITDGYFKVQLQ